MKNFLNILFALLVIASCTKEEKLFNKVQEEAPVFTSSFEEYNIDNKTKTYIDENVKLLWHQADELSIFRSTLNQKYLFDGETETIAAHLHWMLVVTSSEQAIPLAETMLFTRICQQAN